MELENGERPVRQRQDEHRYAQVPPIVQERQESTVEPAKRADAQDDVQQQQRRSPQSSDEQRFRRGVRMHERSDPEEHELRYGTSPTTRTVS